MQSEGEAMALFKSSDLQSNRRAVLDAAARDRAIISDRDGQLVMLPEKRLGNLEKYQNWSLKLARLRSLEKRSDATVAEWGDLAWLKAFDAEDLDAFCDELYDRPWMISMHLTNPSGNGKRPLDNWKIHFDVAYCFPMGLMTRISWRPQPRQMNERPIDGRKRICSHGAGKTSCGTSAGQTFIQGVGPSQICGQMVANCGKGRSGRREPFLGPRVI